MCHQKRLKTDDTRHAYVLQRMLRICSNERTDVRHDLYSLISRTNKVHKKELSFNSDQNALTSFATQKPFWVSLAHVKIAVNLLLK